MSGGVNLITCGLVCLQGVAALGVLVGGVTLLLTSVDRASHWRKRWPLIGLCLWALWMLLLAGDGQHDSEPAVAMTLLVAAVLLRYGRQVRGILDGEVWWPPNANGAGVEITVYMRPMADGGAGLLSVAGRERVHRGRWAPHTFRPGGGLLVAVTDVEVRGRWLALPFASYVSPRIKAQAGWAPSGALVCGLTVSWSGAISVEGDHADAARN